MPFGQRIGDPKSVTIVTMNHPTAQDESHLMCCTRISLIDQAFGMKTVLLSTNT